MPAPRFAFVVNPTAGRRRGDSIARRLAGDVQRAGAAASVFVTEQAGDAARIAAEVADSFDVVVAVGGDGTASHVARG